MVNAKQVKELRSKTGAGMMDAKIALQESSGDFKKAEEILRKKGQLKASKKSVRATGQGIIDSYIHGEGRIGVLVEVNCETDFVAKNADFRSLVHDLALHIAASNPLYVTREEILAEFVEKEKEIYREQAIAEGKPGPVLEKIVAGKLEKFYQETCLLEQPFVKDQDISVKALIESKIASIGENIQVKRFARYVLGE
ncbi:MAG: translation elongation factor Ts [bacterium]|nr:translation elongation factor Ts [bacterium]